MENRLPRAIGGLFSFAGETAIGLHKLRATISPLYSTEEIVRAALAAAQTANADYQTAKSAAVAITAEQEATKKKVVTFLTLARDVLKPVLGAQYSEAWNQVGFVNDTLMIPATMARQYALLQSVEFYFKANPQHAAVGLVTEEIASGLFAEYGDRMSAVNTARREQRLKRRVRDAALDVLTERMRMLYGELKLLLPRNDPRWLQLGFNVPGDKAAVKTAEEVAASVMENVAETPREAVEVGAGGEIAMELSPENGALPHDVTGAASSAAEVPT